MRSQRFFVELPELAATFSYAIEGDRRVPQLMDRGPRQRHRRLGPAPNSKRGNGFSLVELVVVIGVLVTIGFITMPMLFQFIKDATYTAGKQVLYGAQKECLISTGRHHLLEMNGVTFSTSNPQDTCNSVITAAFDDGCIISLDLSTGEKRSAGTQGWPNAYEDCNKQSLLAMNPKPIEAEELSEDQPAAENQIKEEQNTVEETKPHSVEDLGQDEFCGSVANNAPTEHAGKRICAPDPHVLSENIFVYSDAKFWYDSSCTAFSVEKDAAYLATAKKLLAEPSLQTCAEAHNQRTCARSVYVDTMRKNCFPEYVDPRRLTESEITQLESEF